MNLIMCYKAFYYFSNKEIFNECIVKYLSVSTNYYGFLFG